MAISFNNIPSNIRVPLFYGEIDNSQANVVGQMQWNALLVGQMLDDATATELVPIAVSQASQANATFGRGSQLARMVTAFRNNCATGQLYCLPVKVTEGAKAQGRVTFKGTSTEAGYINLYLASDRVRVAVPIKTEASQIAQDTIDAINAVADLPVTAKKATTGAEATSGKLTSGKVTDFSSLESISDGSAVFYIDGETVEVTGVDFSAQATESLTADEIVELLTPKLNSKATIEYKDETFIITSVTKGSQSSVTASTGTDGTDFTNLLKLTDINGAQSAAGTDEEDLSAAIDIIAKGNGDYGNDIIIQTDLRGATGGEKPVNGVSVSIVPMQNGVGEIDVDAIIAAMGDTAYDFIGVPWNDSDTLDKFSLELSDTTGRWSYARALFGHVITAMRGKAPDDLNSLVDFGVTRNDQHASVLGLEEKFASATYDVVGALTGLCATNISIDPARPLQSLTLEGIIGAPLGGGFDLTERNTLLLNGIAAQTTNSDRTVTINRLVTSYRVNTYGDLDISYLDSETLWSLSYVQRFFKTELTSKYPRHKIADDGTRVAPGQAVVTPKTLKAEMIGICYKLENLGVFESVDSWKDEIIVERNITDPSRVDLLIPCNLMNGLRVIAELTQFRL